MNCFDVSFHKQPEEIAVRISSRSRAVANYKQACDWLVAFANFLHCTADSLSTVRLHVTKLVVETVPKATIVRCTIPYRPIINQLVACNSYSLSTVRLDATNTM